MRSLLRLFGIFGVIIRYRLDTLILSTPLLKSFKPLLYLIPWYYFPIKKYTRAQRIRLALERLGPVFIKFGQTLSTRRDLLADDIGAELAKLQDSCPPFEVSKAKQVIEKSAGKSIEKLFASFENKPLASASIAQVHCAVTHSGDKVVVKVVRPGIKKQIERDIKVMYMLAKLVNKHHDGKRLRPLELTKEFENIIFKELNMMTEAANASLLRKNFHDSNMLYVPKIYWELTNPNVLVLERIYGVSVTDIDTLKSNNIDFKRLAENGVKIFFTQVFKDNFFHADMHPGNIFVAKDGKYVGVDFGIMGSLSEADQYYLAENFLAFFSQDYKRVAKAHLDSGWIAEDTNVLEFEAAIRSVCEPIFEKPLGEISFGLMLLSLFKEAKRFNIYIQPQLLLLDKTLLNIEGLGRILYPQLNLWETAKPFLEDLVAEKYSFKKYFKKLKYEAPQILKELPQLPILIINALKQIDNHKNDNNFYKKQINIINKQLQKNSYNQTLITISAACIILSGILATQHLFLPTAISASLALILWFKTDR